MVQTIFGSLYGTVQTPPVHVMDNPQLTLSIGNTTVKVTYLGGYGTEQLFFQYTVEKGMLDEDGIEIGSEIELNGGTIKKMSGGVVNL
ncbi:hypothetical protein [Solibacillus sp.]